MIALPHSGRAASCIWSADKNEAGGSRLDDENSSAKRRTRGRTRPFSPEQLNPSSISLRSIVRESRIPPHLGPEAVKQAVVLDGTLGGDPRVRATQQKAADAAARPLSWIRGPQARVGPHVALGSLTARAFAAEASQARTFTCNSDHNRGAIHRASGCRHVEKKVIDAR